MDARSSPGWEIRYLPLCHLTARCHLHEPMSDFSPRPTPVPLLLTERLRLEPLSMEHATSYREHFVDYEVIRHLSSTVPWPYPEDGVETYFRDHVLRGMGESCWHWALCLLDKPGETIGSVGLFWPGIPENRGFWLGRAFWGKGYMGEAVEAVNTFAFTELGCEQLILSNAVGNRRSRRVKERNGAVYMGVAPSGFVDPEYTESERWLLTRDAWFSR